MKKLALAIAFLLIAMFVLTACGGSNAPRNGTYRSEELLSRTWTLSGRNEITMSAVGGLVTTRGTYTVSGNRLTITSTMLGIETVTTYTITDVTRNSFRINGTRFVRQ